ncbi:FkbM family methyltransferase [Halocatena halophila]|uniref:FkbM family methyltransferase n=1 Tax=Halocatena halophila TaxID=2814576 RepID=UPI002ED08C78
MSQSTHRQLAAVIANRLGVASAIWRLDALVRKLQIAARSGTRRVTVDDVTATFDLSTRMEYRRASDLCGERAVIRRLLSTLEGDETVWDVGACVGTYACFLTEKLADGRLVAFEPEPTNRDRLTVNLERNGPTQNHQILPVALWDKNESLFLDSEYVEAGVGHHFLATDGTAIQIETRRGDSLVQAGDVSAPDVMKIDVQGAELAVLRGCGDLLEDIHTCVVEIHPTKLQRYDATPNEVESLLRGAGFSLVNCGEPTNGRGSVYLCFAQK